MPSPPVRSQASRRRPPPEELTTLPSVLQLQLPEDMSLLEERGLTSTVIALMPNNGFPSTSLINKSGEILNMLLGEEMAEDIELIHDPEWQDFPEIGQALLDAGGEERSLCLAILPGSSIWAVGVFGKWKVREPTARLAFCVAVAAEADADAFAEVAGTWPEFVTLCRSAGVAPNGYEAPVSAPAVKRQRTGEEAPKAQVEATETLPRNVPLWISWPEDVARPELLVDSLEDACVVSTDNKTGKGLYSRADEAVKRLLVALDVAEDDLKEAVQYHDDPSWDIFPAVGAELKKLSSVEECSCLAHAGALGVWGVGVGMKGKARHAAAKAALAGSLVVAAEHAGVLPDFGEDSEIIDEFVEQVKQSHHETYG